MLLIPNLLSVGKQLYVLGLQDLEPAAITYLTYFRDSHTFLAELQDFPFCVAYQVSCALAKLVDLLISTKKPLLADVECNENFWHHVCPFFHVVIGNVAVLFENGN